MEPLIVSARRRFVGPRERRQVLDLKDIVFRANYVPRLLYIYDVEYFINPSISIPKRCYRCQIYGHVATQCRTKDPRCEHCGGTHLSDSCEGRLENDFCLNCGESHKASSSDCQVFKYQFELMKERYLYNVSEEVARNRLAQRGILNFGFIQTQEDLGTRDNEEDRHSGPWRRVFR